MIASARAAWHSPVFSQLLENRRENLLIVGAGIVHLGLNWAGLPGWVCPIRAATGVPCPGCGMTRAAVELLRGEFSASLQTHAFAPLFLLALLLILVALVLPQTQRERFLAFIRRAEIRIGFTSWGLLSMMLYWALRLIE